MFTFILVSGIIVMCVAVLVVLGAYYDYRDAEEYKPYYDESEKE